MYLMLHSLDNSLIERNMLTKIKLCSPVQKVILNVSPITITRNETAYYTPQLRP